MTDKSDLIFFPKYGIISYLDSEIGKHKSVAKLKKSQCVAFCMYKGTLNALVLYIVDQVYIHVVRERNNEHSSKMNTQSLTIDTRLGYDLRIVVPDT